MTNRSHMLPFSRFCDCCERERSADLVRFNISGWRYECDQCQRGHEYKCDACDGFTANPEDDYGEHVCDECLQNRAEAAYERHCEAFHDGGATQFRSLQDQQIEARRLK